MTTIGALMFSIWVTANFCAICYCAQADWPAGRALRALPRLLRSRPRT